MDSENEQKYLDLAKQHGGVQNLGMYAAKTGRMDVLTWVCKHGYHFKNYSDIVYTAIEYGHLNVLEFIISVEFVISVNLKFKNLSACMMYDCAINNGYLHILQWLYKQNILWDSRESHTNICKRIVEIGNGNVLEMLKWAHQISGTLNCDEYTCASAAEYGELYVLQYLRANGCPWSESTCNTAAEAGHLEVLQWAHENGCPWSNKTCREAAGSGHVHILQYIWQQEPYIANNDLWDKKVCDVAATCGKLNALKYLRSIGCPWDERVCECAAIHNHLHIVRWALENGAPIDNIHDITSRLHFDLNRINDYELIQKYLANYIQKQLDTLWEIVLHVIEVPDLVKLIKSYL